MKVLTIIIFSLLFFGACKSGDKTQEDAIPNSDSLIVDTPKNKIVFIAAITGMNLREAPHRNSKVIHSLPYSQKVEVLEKTDITEVIDGLEGEWIKVGVEGKEGYIFNGYILSVLPPNLHPTTTMESYFSENLLTKGQKEVSRKVYDISSESYKKTKIPAEKAVVENESDLFEIRQEYAGGFVYSEEMAYESRQEIGFLPGLTIQEGFLMARVFQPTLGYEGCELNIKNLSFPRENNTFHISPDCTFDLTVSHKNDKIVKISINHSNLGYHGLEITDMNKGIEIKSYYAL